MTAAIVRSTIVLVSMLGEVWVVAWLPAAQLDCRRLRVRCGVVHPRPGIWDSALSPGSGCKSEAGSGSKKNNNIFGDGFAPTLGLGLGLRSKREHPYGWRDNVMLEVHAKCEAKRARGVDETSQNVQISIHFLYIFTTSNSLTRSV